MTNQKFRKFRVAGITCAVRKTHDGRFFATASGHPCGWHETFTEARKAATAKAKHLPWARK